MLEQIIQKIDNKYNVDSVRFNAIYMHGFEYNYKEWRGTQAKISVNEDNQIADCTIQKKR